MDCLAITIHKRNDNIPLDFKYYENYRTFQVIVSLVLSRGKKLILVVVAPDGKLVTQGQGIKSTASATAPNGLKKMKQTVMENTQVNKKETAPASAKVL